MFYCYVISFHLHECSSVLAKFSLSTYKRIAVSVTRHYWICIRRFFKTNNQVWHHHSCSTSVITTYDESHTDNQLHLIQFITNISRNLVSAVWCCNTIPSSIRVVFDFFIFSEIGIWVVSKRLKESLEP